METTMDDVAFTVTRAEAEVLREILLEWQMDDSDRGSNPTSVEASVFKKLGMPDWFTATPRWVIERAKRHPELFGQQGQVVP